MGFLQEVSSHEALEQYLTVSVQQELYVSAKATVSKGLIQCFCLESFWF